MDIETAKTFFLWCTVLSYGILFTWTIVFRFARDWHYNLTVHWFPDLSAERYDMVNLFGIAIFKIAVIMFNLVPYLALCLMSR
jgi:hypothetical protein